MKRVLIVSPRFPPASGPDYHRVRMLLPYLDRFGWRATVLAVDPRYLLTTSEEELRASIPVETEVVLCSAVPERLSRLAGVGSLSLRAIRSMQTMGETLLRSGNFDLVFFSTTEFPLFALGPHWKSRLNIPFIVDLQDPWVNPYHRTSGERPPGGWFKHSIHQAVAKYQERRVLMKSAHIICTSPAYPATLKQRYPELPSTMFSVIPFAGSRRDFDIALRGHAKPETRLIKTEGRFDWVYAGAVIPGMVRGIAAVFGALRRAFDNETLSRSEVRLHFVGTNYASETQAHPRVRSLAADFDVADVVVEIPHRLGYLETLRTLVNADALMIFGSDEAGYSPSKLFTYVLAGKPLLAVGHSDGDLAEKVTAVQAGVGVTYSDQEDQDSIADKVYRHWISERDFDRKPATDWHAVAPFLDDVMAEEIVQLFDSAVDAGKR